MIINPEEITQDVDTGRNVASFEYYLGVREAKSRNLKQSTSLTTDTFIVCCGYVMFEIMSTEYPAITRRIF
jgi:hypothetical protein